MYELPPQIKIIYVCTDRGESRAPAIVAALMPYFGHSDKQVWRDYKFHPDIDVYKKLCKEFGIFMPSFLVRYKKYISDKSLKRKIKAGQKNDICNE